MNPNDDQTAQWLAYLLGDLESDEATRVEAEMLADPDKAGEIKRFFEATSDWAKRPVADAPVDMAQLVAQARGAAVEHRARTPFRAAWPWAAAAVILTLAVTQASFSVQIGDSILAWGESPESEVIGRLERELSTLNESYAELAADNLRLYDGFEGFVRNLHSLEMQLQVATTELALNLERESYARYADMERMLETMQETRAALAYGSGPAAVQASYNGRP